MIAGSVEKCKPCRPEHCKTRPSLRWSKLQRSFMQSEHLAGDSLSSSIRAISCERVQIFPYRFRTVIIPDSNRSENVSYCHLPCHKNTRVTHLAFTFISCSRSRSISVQFIQETPGGYISVVEARSLKGMVTQHRIVVSYLRCKCLQRLNPHITMKINIITRDETSTQPNLGIRRR